MLTSEELKRYCTTLNIDCVELFLCGHGLELAERQYQSFNNPDPDRENQYTHACFSREPSRDISSTHSKLMRMGEKRKIHFITTLDDIDFIESEVKRPIIYKEETLKPLPSIDQPYDLQTAIRIKEMLFKIEKENQVSKYVEFVKFAREIDLVAVFLKAQKTLPISFQQQLRMYAIRFFLKAQLTDPTYRNFAAFELKKEYFDIYKCANPYKVILFLSLILTLTLKKILSISNPISFFVKFAHSISVKQKTLYLFKCMFFLSIRLALIYFMLANYGLILFKSDQITLSLTLSTFFIVMFPWRINLILDLLETTIFNLSMPFSFFHRLINNLIFSHVNLENLSAFSILIGLLALIAYGVTLTPLWVIMLNNKILSTFILVNATLISISLYKNLNSIYKEFCSSSLTEDDEGLLTLDEIWKFTYLVISTSNTYNFFMQILSNIFFCKLLIGKNLFDVILLELYFLSSWSFDTHQKKIVDNFEKKYYFNPMPSQPSQTKPLLNFGYWSHRFFSTPILEVWDQLDPKDEDQIIETPTDSADLTIALLNGY